jgi:hypothetical protein
MTEAPTDDRSAADNSPLGGQLQAKARARAVLRDLIVELARIAAAEDDAAEQRRDMATPCSTR